MKCSSSQQLANETKVIGVLQIYMFFLIYFLQLFFPLPLSLSLSFNLSIYLFIILHVFYVIGTNTHQPKIMDLQQFTNANNQYYVLYERKI